MSERSPQSFTLIFWGIQILLVASCLLGIAALVAQQRALNAVVHTHEVQAQLERVLNRLVDAETGQRGFLIAGTAEHLEPYRAATAVIGAEIARTAALTADNPRQQAAIAKLRSKIEERLNLLAGAIRLHEQGQPGAALEVVRAGEGVRLMREIRGDIAAMDAAEARLLIERTEHARRFEPAGWLALSTLSALSLSLLWRYRRSAAREQQRIGASERHLSTTVSSIADGVISTDPRGCITGMNPVAETLAGYTAAEARGKPLNEVCVLADDVTGAPLDNPAHLVMRRRAVVDFMSSARIRARSGEQRTVELKAAPMQRDGELEGVVLVMRDVTERKRAAQALHDTQARFQQVLEALPQLVWTCASDGRTTFVSRQWLEYTGTTLEQNLGYGWKDVVHPQDRDRLAGEWRQSIEAGEIFDAESRLRGADGRFRWFKQLAVPIRDDRGTIKEWFGSSTEITDIINARESIRRTNSLLEARVEERTHELQEANADLQAFAHSVAHDLRAPLRNIQGYATAIIEDEGPRLSDEGALYARRMAESAGRLDGLIQDLLAYSRLSRTEINPEPVELRDVVEKVLRDLASEIAVREAIVEVTPPLPRVLAHRVTLAQAITNLVSNALKFVAADVTPAIVISARREGSSARLTIADNGIGVAPEHHERIFRVFERLHGSETYPGTGIGLAIVRRGVERMGGRVDIESRPGEGSRFTIELPAAEPA